MSGPLGVVCFFFQAEDGIRDLVRSRGLGDVYKRQHEVCLGKVIVNVVPVPGSLCTAMVPLCFFITCALSLIHI